MSKGISALIILSLSILCACSKGEASRSERRNQARNIDSSGTPSNTSESDERTLVIKEGGKLCEAHLLKEVSKDKAEDNQLETLKSFNRNDKLLSNGLRKWLEIADEETLSVHELRYGEKKALLLNATHIHATGLAINFQYWFISLEDQHVEFISQSKNPTLIFWDKGGTLNYYAIDFSDNFLLNKDWNNVTLNLLRYKRDANGNSRLVSEERNVKCD
jgi:hypothetical protein